MIVTGGGTERGARGARGPDSAPRNDQPVHWSSGTVKPFIAAVITMDSRR